MPKQPKQYPNTPDGRYFVVRGRLWRSANPDLPEEQRRELVRLLMKARREVGVAKRAGEDTAPARRRVDDAKRGLGERGPPWWQDGAPDLNRRMVANTPYAEWYAALDAASGPPAAAAPAPAEE